MTSYTTDLYLLDTQWRKTIQVQTLQCISILFFWPTIYTLLKLKGYILDMFSKTHCQLLVHLQNWKIQSQIKLEAKTQVLWNGFLDIVTSLLIQIIKQHLMLIDSKAINTKYLSVDKLHHWSSCIVPTVQRKTIKVQTLWFISILYFGPQCTHCLS